VCAGVYRSTGYRHSPSTASVENPGLLSALLPPLLPESAGAICYLNRHSPKAIGRAHQSVASIYRRAEGAPQQHALLQEANDDESCGRGSDDIARPQSARPQGPYGDPISAIRCTGGIVGCPAVCSLDCHRVPHCPAPPQRCAPHAEEHAQSAVALVEPIRWCELDEKLHDRQGLPRVNLPAAWVTTPKCLLLLGLLDGVVKWKPRIEIGQLARPSK
jgi:hypothetical protein